MEQRKRLTTENPQGNFEMAMNYVFDKDREFEDVAQEVRMTDVTVARYFQEYAKTFNREPEQQAKRPCKTRKPLQI